MSNVSAATYMGKGSASEIVGDISTGTSVGRDTARYGYVTSCRSLKIRRSIMAQIVGDTTKLLGIESMCGQRTCNVSLGMID